MTVTKQQDGNALVIKVEGRVDTTTAPELEKEVSASLEGVTDLSFDMSALEYISSAGLRVLLSTQKKMNKQGSMVIKNVSSTIMEIFEVTGFTNFLTIE